MFPIRSRGAAAALLTVLLAAAGAVHAQEAQAVQSSSAARPASAPRRLPEESAIARARTAKAIQDTLATLTPAQATAVKAEPAVIRPEVLGFLERPFQQPQAPSLAVLDSTLGWVHAAAARLRAQGQSKAANQIALNGQSVTSANPIHLPAAAGAAAFFPSQSALIVGLADFMVERAKDEAVFSFMLHLRGQVRDKPLVTAGMPRSWALMGRLDTETFQSLMPAVRVAFAEDLDLLPQRLNSDSVRVAMKWTNGTPTYVQGLAIVFARGLEIRRGVPAVVALQNLVDVDENTLSDDTVRSVVHVVGLLSREYATGGSEMVDELRGSRMERRYFTAFLTHDAVRLGALGELTRVALLTRVDEREADLMILVNQLQSLSGARAPLDELKDASAEELAQRALAGVGPVLEVIGAARRFLPSGSDGVERFDRLVNDATVLHQALVSREYGRIVTWLLTQTEFAQATHDPEVMRYLTVAAELASARNSAEVTVALRTAAAPVGSYRSKRSPGGSGWRPQSVSVVGYLGATAGWEGTKDTRLFGDAHHVGLSLPVGVEVSTGFPGGALSLFASVLDLGTVASARLGGPDDVDSSPEVGFGQVFAPGLFSVWNFKGVPLSFGVGIQAVPNLRERTTAAGDKEQVDVVRFGAFIGVDATLFHFRFRKAPKPLEVPVAPNAALPPPAGGSAAAARQ